MGPAAAPAKQLSSNKVAKAFNAIGATNLQTIETPTSSGLNGFDGYQPIASSHWQAAMNASSDHGPITLLRSLSSFQRNHAKLSVLKDMLTTARLVATA